MPVGRGSSRGRGSYIDRRKIEGQMRDKGEEEEERMQREEEERMRMQREEEERMRMQREEEERMQRESVNRGRGLPANRGRGPGRWNTVGERFDMLAASEAPVPEYVPAIAVVAPAVLPAVASEPESPLSEEERVRAHMKYMEDLRRRRPLLPPQYTDPSEYYKNYHVSDTARNFPIGHNYTEPAAERPAITLSPEAQAYEESQKKLADDLESLERGWGGGRKKKSTRTRQKKHRRHRHRRRSTKKYRK
jgi:hypothetical protein